MEMPSVIYGIHSDVRKACRKVVTKLSQGSSWSDAVLVEGSTETQQAPGLLVMEGPSPLLGCEAHYHCYLLWQLIRQAISSERLASELAGQVFEESLRTQWGTLGLLCHANVMWIYPQDRHKPLLEAATRHWAVLDGEGARYTNGSREGAHLWAINSNLKYVLFNMGIDDRVLSAPLPPGGLSSIVKQLHDFDASPDIESR